MIFIASCLSGFNNLSGLNHHRTQWDTHPLIRQFFSGQFQQQHPQAFQQAHKVLFEYFQAVPEKHQPDTLAELEPLYRAVVHGCLAREYKKAQGEVYWQRILRGDKYYSLQKLGAYSQDLIALSAFFPRGWLQPVVSSGLSEENQAWLLAEASFCLMPLGRLAEAVALREAATNWGAKLAAKSGDWYNAAVSVGNLTNLLLPLGKLHEAETTARLAIDYVQRTEDKFVQTKDKFVQMASYSHLATVLHRLGQLQQSQQLFAQAEQLLQQDEPDHPYLYSLWGAQYCAFLLDTASDTADLEQVLKRGKYALELKTTTPLIDYAFNSLTIARTYQALLQPQTASKEYNLAVQAIQKAGTIIYMPEFYLTRADFYLSQNELEKAEADIKTANHTIARCSMKLYAVDAALLQAHLHLALNKKETASKFCEQAEMLITETGYHLRDKALAALKQSLRL